MNVLLVLAHPRRRSLTGLAAEAFATAAAERGHLIEWADLVTENFDPVLREADEPDWNDGIKAYSAEVRQEMARIENNDATVMFFPVYWWSMPAILKGWIDRVLVYGGTYTSERRYDRGLLTGKRAMLSVTFGGAESTFAHNGRNGDVELLLWPMQMTLFYVGYQVLSPFTAFGVAGASNDAGKAAVSERLDRYKALYRERLLFIDDAPALKFNGWADWDDAGRLKPGIPGYSKFMRADP